MTQASGKAWDFTLWQRTQKPQVRDLLNTWLLESRAGRPLALDVPWLGRRRLQAIVERGKDQRPPNPELEGYTDGRRLAGAPVQRLIPGPRPVQERSPLPPVRQVA